MATKKEIEAVRREARVELYGVLLALEFAIQDLEEYRTYFQDSAKYITKTISDTNKIFSKLKVKYEKVTNMKYTRKK